MIDNSNKLPGYTGHVPFRNECIGLTTGNANKESQIQYETFTDSMRTKKGKGKDLLSMTGSSLLMKQKVGMLRDEKLSDYQAYQSEKSKTYGTNSKNSISWMCGPQHQIRAQ